MQFSPRTISRIFGSPKPSLANSFEPELLNLRTFPTLMGYSSRILAESWESNLLYYGALADEIHATPAELNVLVPEWTKQTVRGNFRDAPGGLAGAAALPENGGRSGARAGAQGTAAGVQSMSCGRPTNELMT